MSRVSFRVGFTRSTADCLGFGSVWIRTAMAFLQRSAVVPPGCCLVSRVTGATAARVYSNSTVAATAELHTVGRTPMMWKTRTTCGQKQVERSVRALGQVEELAPLDLFLEDPIFLKEVEPAEYDLVTGRLNPEQLGPRNRQVFLRKGRSTSPEANGKPSNAGPGQFRPCAVCGQDARFGRSSVQDHQTKGDQPFQALIAKQIQVQPPNPVEATELAPLRGRKVLVFSDSRQTAARLAPNLQTYSTQDALRPLIVSGYARLARSPILADRLSLEDLYLGVLVAAQVMGVRLRPELKEW